MTNKERLLQDGSNCPWRDNEYKKDCNEKLCTEECRKLMIERLGRIAKGRRWLEGEIVDEGDNK